jgi:hypothetical protein
MSPRNRLNAQLDFYRNCGSVRHAYEAFKETEGLPVAKGFGISKVSKTLL